MYIVKEIQSPISKNYVGVLNHKDADFVAKEFNIIRGYVKFLNTDTDETFKLDYSELYDFINKNFDNILFCTKTDRDSYYLNLGSKVDIELSNLLKFDGRYYDKDFESFTRVEGLVCSEYASIFGLMQEAFSVVPITNKLYYRLPKEYKELSQFKLTVGKLQIADGKGTYSQYRITDTDKFFRLMCKRAVLLR